MIRAHPEGRGLTLIRLSYLMILVTNPDRRKARMSDMPLCAKCRRPMPNWLGAVSRQSPSCFLVCQKCFGKLANAPFQSRVPVKLDQSLLDLVKTEDDRLKSIACLALQSSIKEADAQGIFSDPNGRLKKALKTLYPEIVYDYNLLQNARKLLIKHGLWLPQGERLKGKGTRQSMRLGEKIRLFSAPP